MADFGKARRMMVDGQVRTVDVTDRPLLAALGEIPREKFVPGHLRNLAYLDRDLEIAPAAGGRGARYLIEVGPFARLVQAAEVQPTDVVLDVGCGTGYSAAVLSRLVGSVVALESDPELVRAANAVLGELGIDNVAVVTAPLDAGYRSEGPYDAILLEGAVEVVPDALLDQLKPDGRLVAVVGTDRTARATIYRRSGEGISARPVFDAYIAALPGFQKPKAFVF
jgi:protein-L-isoaspartate(D-aspartate) O-methyltransferase